MDAFHYANHTNQAFDSASTPGFQRAGELRLDGGNYVVTAKLSAGVSTGVGYPPPAWPWAGGAAFLTLANVHDMAFITIKPEAGENHDSLTLSIAAKISGRRRVRLYYLPTSPLRTFISRVRITAIRVDKLNVTEVGVDETFVPDDPVDMMLNHMFSPTSQPAIAELLHELGDED